MTDEARRCDGCLSERRCREYMGLWFCVGRRGDCWRHRRDLYALKKAGRLPR